MAETWFEAVQAIATAADYNWDGQVDAADYTVWRDLLGEQGLVPFTSGDGNGDGRVTLRLRRVARAFRRVLRLRRPHGCLPGTNGIRSLPDGGEWRHRQPHSGWLRRSLISRLFPRPAIS